MTDTNVCARLAGLALEVLSLRPDIKTVSISNAYRDYNNSSNPIEDAIVKFYGAHGAVDDISLDGVAPVRRLEKEAHKLLLAVEHDQSTFESMELSVSREETSAAVSTGLDSTRIVRWRDAAAIGMKGAGRHEYVLQFLVPEDATGHELVSLPGISTVEEMRAHPVIRHLLREMEDDGVSEAILEDIGTLSGDTPARTEVRKGGSQSGAEILFLFIATEPGDELVRLL